MKRIVLITLASALLFAVSGCAASSRNSSDKITAGSGKLVTRTIAASRFDAVQAQSAIAVVLSDEASDRITVSADDNIIDHVQVGVKGGTLVAELDGTIHNLNNVHITVTAPVPQHIRSFEVSGAASIACDAVLNADDMQIKASGAGRIKTSLKASSCAITGSGAAHIDCDMQCAQQCTAGISGATHLTLTGRAAQCSIEASGASQVEDALQTDGAHDVITGTGASHIDLTGGNASSYDIIASGASHIDAAIETENCRIQDTGASRVTLTGNSKACVFEVSGSSRLSAEALASVDCTVKASGGSSVAVNATGNFHAEASGGASIRNAGKSATNEITKSGGGSVSYNE